MKLRTIHGGVATTQPGGVGERTLLLVEAHPSDDVRVLQEARGEEEVQRVPAAHLLRQDMPKEGLDAAAQQAVQEAAASVCAAAAGFARQACGGGGGRFSKQ